MEEREGTQSDRNGSIVNQSFDRNSHHMYSVQQLKEYF
jgi:hypothetical protein